MMEWYIHMMECHSALKRKEFLIHATLMNLEYMLSEISQSQKDKCCVSLLVWRYLKQTDSQRQKVEWCFLQLRGDGGGELAFNMYKVSFGKHEKVLEMVSSLVVQWLGLGTFTAVAWVQPLVWELRSHINPLHDMDPKFKKYKSTSIMTKKENDEP